MSKWDRTVSFLTGEWILEKSRNGNGGGVVTLRAAWTTVLLYLLALWIWEASGSDGLQPSWTAFVHGVHDTIEWLGIIFAGMFTSLYARFSQQWTYLANVYNQIKAAEVSGAGRKAIQEPLAQWKAGFMIDAAELHLAEKPLFRWTIRWWFEDADVAGAVREEPENLLALRGIVEMSEDDLEALQQLQQSRQAKRSRRFRGHLEKDA